jgi:hypothetical protein
MMETTAWMLTNGLLHPLVVVVQSSDDVASCFTYELRPNPTALFKDGFMRKPNKEMLYKQFCKDLTPTSLPSDIFVVYCGCLPSPVKLQKGSTGDYVTQMYFKYVTFRFKLSGMFDGYDSGADVKDHEHLGR